MNDDFCRTKKCVDHYRKLGLCPLPSRMVKPKGPMLTAYAQFYQGEQVPESVYDDWQTTNIQIITGTKSPTTTKILVVDCDGEEAADRWDEILAHHKYVPDRSWISATGGGGYHTYFTIPDGIESCPSGMIWGLWDTWGEDGRGKWVKHKEVRILADNALVIAPPSKHVDTGWRYEFTGTQNPNRRHLPAPAPDWLLAIPRLVNPRFTEPPKPVYTPKPYVRQSNQWYTREEVLDAVGNQKFSIATREWGLISSVAEPNANGWCNCYVPGRENPRSSRPSGSFHFRDGTLQDRKDLSTITFFDLGVLLNRFSTWQECRDALGDRFIGKSREKSTYKYCF